MARVCLLGYRGRIIIIIVINLIKIVVRDAKRVFGGTVARFGVVVVTGTERGRSSARAFHNVHDPIFCPTTVKDEFCEKRRWKKAIFNIRYGRFGGARAG